MRFFEVSPYASAEDALSEIQWLAEKNHTKCNSERERREERHDSGPVPAPRTGATSGRRRPAEGR